MTNTTEQATGTPDAYPELPTLPADKLVPNELQPEYLEPHGVSVAQAANVGLSILGGPDRKQTVALVHHELDREFTYGDLEMASARLANALQAHGLRPGERLAIRSTNRPEAIIAALAAWRTGAIVVPTPAAARADELRFLLQDTGARAFISCGGRADLCDVEDGIAETDVKLRVLFDAADTPNGWLAWDDLQAKSSARFTDRPLPPNLPAIIWHTGGTTGTPKACYHTHRRYLLAGATFGQAAECRPGRRWAAAAPAGHALGFLCHTTFTLLHGATAVMTERFAEADAVLDAIARRRVDTFVAITATWARMLEALEADPAIDRIASLRRGYAMWQSASSGAVFDGWHNRGIELLNNFGSTAFANWVLIPRPPEEIPRASLGRATPGYVVRAVDPDGGSLDPLDEQAIGRLAVKGPTGLTYWDRPFEQERDVVDGWTLCDDLIALDSHGYAEYLGRTDYMISSAGYKIAPVEVEVVLARHPAVAEVGVVGTPDPTRLEVVTAFIVLRDTSAPDSSTVHELQSWVKTNLSPYKYPRRVEFVDALPRDPVGKVQPRVLKQWAEERAAMTKGIEL